MDNKDVQEFCKRVLGAFSDKEYAERKCREKDDYIRKLQNGHERMEVTRSEWVYRGREEVFDISGVRTWGARYQCRNCGFEPIFIEDHGRYNFCPNCGADMRGNGNV